MIFLIIHFFAYATSILAQSGNQTDLWGKLENFQNVTGISDEIKLSIWRKSGNIRTGVNQGESFTMEV